MDDDGYMTVLDLGMMVPSDLGMTAPGALTEMTMTSIIAVR